MRSQLLAELCRVERPEEQGTKVQVAALLWGPPVLPAAEGSPRTSLPPLPSCVHVQLSNSCFTVETQGTTGAKNRVPGASGASSSGPSPSSGTEQTAPGSERPLLVFPALTAPSAAFPPRPSSLPARPPPGDPAPWRPTAFPATGGARREAQPLAQGGPAQPRALVAAPVPHEGLPLPEAEVADGAAVDLPPAGALVPAQRRGRAEGLAAAEAAARLLGAVRLLVPGERGPGPEGQRAARAEEAPASRRLRRGSLGPGARAAGPRRWGCGHGGPSSHHAHRAPACGRPRPGSGALSSPRGSWGRGRPHAAPHRRVRGRVCALVALELGAVAEALAAAGAGVRPVAQVHAAVAAQARGVAVGLVAEGAAEGPLPEVGAPVAAEGLGAPEGLPALAAAVRPLQFVAELVVAEAGALAEAPAADRAGEGEPGGGWERGGPARGLLLASCQDRGRTTQQGSPESPAPGPLPPASRLTLHPQQHPGFF